VCTFHSFQHFVSHVEGTDIKPFSSNILYDFLVSLEFFAVVLLKNAIRNVVLLYLVFI